MRQPPHSLQAIRSLAGLVLILWLVLPLVPLAIWSFARGWRFPDLLPQDWSLQAWRFTFSEASGVGESLTLTVGISGAVTLISVLIGVPAGRALGGFRFRGKQIVELIILAPTIVPGIAVVLGIHSIFIALGLNNTVTGVILVHLVPTLPYVILVMAAVFANHDPAHEQQARSLGAGPLQVFWYITLPAILPGVLVAGLFAFLVSWSQYILTLTIGGGRVITLPLLLFNFASAGRNDMTGAIGMLYILPRVVILLFTSRYLSGQTPAVGRP
jgi:putative spermidine/putrescine transport system permease protein